MTSEGFFVFLNANTLCFIDDVASIATLPASNDIDYTKTLMLHSILFCMFLQMEIPYSSFSAESMVTDTEVIQLPQPDKQVKMTLFDALQQRHSSRTFAKRALDNATLSQLLWAAAGINRPAENKLTAPSAMNRQSVSLYVCNAKGAYLWDATMNTLTLVSPNDLRPLITNGQKGIGDYPVALVIVGENAKFDTRATETALPVVNLDAAIVSQNINLGATALHLNNVPRVNMDITLLKKELKLSDTQFPILNNLIGYPK